MGPYGRHGGSVLGPVLGRDRALRKVISECVGPHVGLFSGQLTINVRIFA